jgi:flagellar M-ring protein FliF
MATALTTDAAPSALQGLGRLSVVRQMVLLGALAGSIALGVGIALWSQRPSFTLLYGDLAVREAKDVVDALTQAGIEFQLDHATGAVLVPSSKVHDARLRLAGQGLPKSTNQGMEQLGEKQPFGTSQFIERARYKHALEVELSRTIAEFNNVDTARVHLAVPRQSAFLKRNHAPSASVLVRLAAGRKLEPWQAGAIAHLVASAVPNLESRQVRVVDEKGRLLTEPDGDDRLGLSRREFDYTRDLEEHYIRRIEAILMPVLGPDGVKAQVVAEVDFSQVERSRESYNPDAPALRSEQLLEERGGAQLAGGIPGALTNQPPGAGVVPETAPAGAGGGRGAQAGGQDLRAAAGERARSKATRNYELDRTVSHTLTPSGRLRRLSVAVVVDDQRVASEAGEVTLVARTPEEVANLTALVKDAIGFDAERGDTVNVINAAFTAPEAIVPVPPLPIWQEPWVWDVARQVGGVLLVVLIAFGVFRPVMRNLVVREVTERELEQARLAGQASLTADEIAASTGGQVVDALPGASREAQRLDTIRQLVSEDPRRVANVVRSWVGDDG